jgi:hypothetical protein
MPLCQIHCSSPSPPHTKTSTIAELGMSKFAPEDGLGKRCWAMRSGHETFNVFVGDRKFRKGEDPQRMQSNHSKCESSFHSIPNANPNGSLTVDRLFIAQQSIFFLQHYILSM